MALYSLQGGKSGLNVRSIFMPNQISIAILCGGESRRMGVDKATLVWNEKSFIEQISDEMKDMGELFLSVRKGRRYSYIEGTYVEDKYDGCGPLAGLHSILQEIDTDAVFVTTVDLPLADKTLVRELEEYMMPSVDAVVPVTEDGRIHPLCAIYRKSVYDKVDELLIHNDYKVSDLLKSLRVSYVPANMLTDGDRKLLNINTPDDFKKLQYA